MTALKCSVPRACFLETTDGHQQSGGYLFAWHHAPSSERRRHYSVVLCPALGYEYMSSYRSMRVLAERLASLGFDVMRFDYEGTGNSSGGFRDADRFLALRRSVVRAIEKIRAMSCAHAVALVGLRAGALLATQAAADAGGVERLVLWSAVPSGRAYVRELMALAGISARDQEAPEADDPVVTVAGHSVTKETLAQIASWTADDLASRPAQQILIVDRDDRPSGSRLRGRLTALGAAVTTIS